LWTVETIKQNHLATFIHLYLPETVANNEKKKKKYRKNNYLQNIQIQSHTVETTDKIVFLCKLFTWYYEVEY